jgi:hypothetical protein
MNISTRRFKRLFNRLFTGLAGKITANILCALLALSIAIGVSGTLSNKSKLLNSEPTLAILLASAAIAVGMLYYLNQEDPARKELVDGDSLIAKFSLLEIQARLSDLESRSIGISEDSRDAIVDSLVNDASAKIADAVDSEFENRYGSARETLKKTSLLEANVKYNTERLNQEIRALLKRGNLNLVLGTLASIFAIIVLVYTAIFTAAYQGRLSEVLQAYALRLSLVIFIQIFGFFFLRLYQASLSDIKFFQNEITNIQQQWLALKYALVNEDKDAAKAIASILAATERNFTIKKGETTIDLERLKIDQNDLKILVSSLKGPTKGKG